MKLAIYLTIRKLFIALLLIAINYTFFLRELKAQITDSTDYKSLILLPLNEILKLKVIGVSKYEESYNKAPASVIIITEEQIEDNNYQDLSDILKNTIGIDVVDNARGYGELYTIRGIEGNDRFLVLVDGQKINPSSGTFLSVGNSISISFAKRIEIIFGPSSVMYGADAFSGIINIVSKEVTNNISVSANIDYGSLNSKNAKIETRFKINNNFNISAFARIFNSDGPNFIGRDSIYDIIKLYKPPQINKFEQPIKDHTIFLKTSYKNFTLSYFRQRFNEGNALGMSTEIYIYNKENLWALSNNILWLLYDKSFNEKSKLSASIAYINHVQDPQTQFHKWANGSFLNKSYSQYMTGIDNSIRTSIIYNNTIFEKYKFVSGIEYEYTKSIPPYANDQLIGASKKFEGTTKDIIKNEMVQELRFAGFSQLTYSPIKTLNFVLGGRYDYSTRNEGTFNPRISIVYTPLETTSIKLLYGTAFQAPSLFYQYEQWGSATAVMLSAEEIKKTNPSWKLYNQKVKTWEALINQKPSNKIIIYISGYLSILNNLIEREVFTDYAYNKYFSTQDSSVYSIGIRNANVDTHKFYGLNLKPELHFNKRIYGYLSYSYIHAIDKNENISEIVPRIANHKFWLGFVYKNIFKYFNISTRIKWIGDISNNNIAFSPDKKQPGYFNMDLSLHTSNMVKPINFYIRIDNIFNSYYSNGGLLDQVVYLPTIPQNGIVGRVGIEFKFNK